MSRLSDETDKQVIQILIRCLEILEGTDKCQVTKVDDAEITLAKNKLKSVIENYE
ncbi:hypothetical protein [Mucilaginibacter sp.]